MSVKTQLATALAPPIPNGYSSGRVIDVAVLAEQDFYGTWQPNLGSGFSESGGDPSIVMRLNLKTGRMTPKTNESGNRIVLSTFAP
jgi:hypothetical protein